MGSRNYSHGVDVICCRELVRTLHVPMAFHPHLLIISQSPVHQQHIISRSPLCHQITTSQSPVHLISSAKWWGWCWWCFVIGSFCLLPSQLLLLLHQLVFRPPVMSLTIHKVPLLLRSVGMGQLCGNINKSFWYRYIMLYRQIGQTGWNLGVVPPLPSLVRSPLIQWYKSQIVDETEV